MAVTDKIAAEQPDSKASQPSLRRYRMRWFALLPLAAAALALVLHVDGYAFTAPLAAIASGIASWLALFGPPRERLWGEVLDEREELERLRSHTFGGRVTVGLALTGIGIIAWSTELGGWRPTNGFDWLVILFVLSTVFACMPILHASWTTRPIEEEE